MEEALIPDDIDVALGPLFARADWVALALTSALAFVVYCSALAPTVTLEYSGTLAVAADHLGVGHTSGYPSWTILGWIFQKILFFATYRGQPNPAWAVGLMSAFFGALACGVTAMLVCRSGAAFIGPATGRNGEMSAGKADVVRVVAAVTSGLVLALSPTLWSQSVIVETHSLHAFFVALLLLLTYAWIQRPHDVGRLYLVAFVFGVAMTNHQATLFVAPGLVCAIALGDRKLFFSMAICLGATAATARCDVSLLNFFLLAAVYLAVTAIFLPAGRRCVITLLWIGIGLAIYGYLPLASETNPPINWGYARTWDGFVHVVSRGQFEQPRFGNPFTVEFLRHVGMYADDLRRQFTWPVVLLGLLSLPLHAALRLRGRGDAAGDGNHAAWLPVIVVSSLGVSLLLLLLLQPKGDLQDLFLKRVQFIASHVIFGVWIGYGFTLLLSTLALRLRSRGLFLGLSIALVLVAIATPVYRNRYDHELLKAYGGSEQDGHDYGWQFGNYQLRGMEAILEELGPGDRPPPNPDYPPPMTPGAVLFGGTDPGRFVLTYMIFSALVRSDVFLLTQNALADNTYISAMRDLYGDDIWTPSVHESSLAFQRYVQEVRDGTRTPNAQLKVDNGRVRVTGVQGVMEINGILAEMMFEHNKFKHDFYVEESYVIPWMYPYMEPHGLILKVNKEKLTELSPEVVKNDMQFWSWYTRRLLSDDAFVRDVVARKSFSKLRSAIAGLYAYRRMFKEAEIAFKQSLRLYDLSPEANFRLTEVYRQQLRFKDAIALTRRFCAKDPGNRQSASILQRMTAQQDRFSRMRELEVKTRKQAPLQDVLELMALYREFNPGRCRQYAQNLLNNDQVHPNVYLEVAKLFEQIEQWPAVLQAIERHVQRVPENPKAWLRLAEAALKIKPMSREQASQLRDLAFAALREAVDYGGDPYREIVARDPTFVEAFGEDPRFRSLLRRQDGKR